MPRRKIAEYLRHFSSAKHLDESNIQNDRWPYYPNQTVWQKAHEQAQSRPTIPSWRAGYLVPLKLPELRGYLRNFSSWPHSQSHNRKMLILWWILRVVCFISRIKVYIFWPRTGSAEAAAGSKSDGKQTDGKIDAIFLRRIGLTISRYGYRRRTKDYRSIEKKSASWKAKKQQSQSLYRLPQIQSRKKSWSEVKAVIVWRTGENSEQLVSGVLAAFTGVMVSKRSMRNVPWEVDYPGS